MPKKRFKKGSSFVVSWPFTDFSHAVAIRSAEGCEKGSLEVHRQKACIQAFHVGSLKGRLSVKFLLQKNAMFFQDCP